MEASSICFYIESGASDHTRLVEISATDSGRIYTYVTGIFITVGGADGDKGGGGGTGAGTRKGDSRGGSKGAQEKVWQHFPVVFITYIAHPGSMRDSCRLGGTPGYVRVKQRCGNGMGTCFPTSRD